MPSKGSLNDSALLNKCELWQKSSVMGSLNTEDKVAPTCPEICCFCLP